MTCNLLSFEKHNWQQHCDFFFPGYRKVDKIGVELSPASVSSCCTPTLCRPGGPYSSLSIKGVMCHCTSQIERLQKKRSRAMDPLHHKSNIWNNGQLLSQRQCCIWCPSIPVQKRKGHRNGDGEADSRGVAGILRPRSSGFPIDPSYPFNILENPRFAKKGITAHIIKRLGCLQAIAQVFFFFFTLLPICLSQQRS